jgi:hypothetical protein
MAKQRVQVAGLQTPTTVTPVATTVDTYVRPPSLPEGGSPLQQFIANITPAVEEVTRIEKAKRVKREIEIENGIKRQKAAEAKLARKTALRLAGQAASEALATDPDLYYGDDGETALTEVRAAAMAPILDEITDEEVRNAVEQDIKVGNIGWYETNYDPKKGDYVRGKTLGNVFTEVTAIEDDANLSFEEKKVEIQTLLQETVDSYPNIGWANVNNAAVTVIKSRVDDNGTGALFAVLDDANQFSTANFYDAGLSIKASKEKYEKEATEEIVSDAITEMIAIENKTNISSEAKQAMIEQVITQTLANNPFVERSALTTGMAIITTDRMFENETTPMYEILSKDEEATTNPDNAPSFDSINKTIASTRKSRKVKEAKALADAEALRLEQADAQMSKTHLTTAVLSFMADGPSRLLYGADTEITLPSGKKYTITKEEAQDEYERQSATRLQEKIDSATAESAMTGADINTDAIAQRHLAEDFKKFYTKTGTLPNFLSDPLTTNTNVLVSQPISDVNDEETLARAEGVLTAYRSTIALGGSLNYVNNDQEVKYRLEALDFLTTKAGMTLPTALAVVQGPRKSVSIGALDVEDLTTSGRWFSSSVFKDVTNMGHVSDYVRQGTQYYMSMKGMTKDLALKAMGERVQEDFIVVEDKAGNKRAIQKLSGELSVGVPKLQTFLDTISEVDTLTDIAESAFGEGSVFTVSNDYDNPNVIQLVVTNDTGTQALSLASIPMADIDSLNMELVISNILRDLGEQLPSDLGNQIGSVSDAILDSGLTEEQFRRKYPFSGKGQKPIEETWIGETAQLVDELGFKGTITLDNRPEYMK